MKAGVAAGHPATAEAGAEILADGGTAADAAVAMCLASCVAETVMTGLLGGGHAIWWDGRHGALIDCFVGVPHVVGVMDDLPVAFGEEVVDYRIGPHHVASPVCRPGWHCSTGLAAGCRGSVSSSRPPVSPAMGWLSRRAMPRAW